METTGYFIDVKTTLATLLTHFCNSNMLPCYMDKYLFVLSLQRSDTGTRKSHGYINQKTNCNFSNLFKYNLIWAFIKPPYLWKKKKKMILYVIRTWCLFLYYYNNILHIGSYDVVNYIVFCLISCFQFFISLSFLLLPTLVNNNIIILCSIHGKKEKKKNENKLRRQKFRK